MAGIQPRTVLICYQDILERRDADGEDHLNLSNANLGKLQLGFGSRIPWQGQTCKQCKRYTPYKDTLSAS